MTRSGRVAIPGCAHHVTHRGNRKAVIFKDDSDRLVYLRLMRDACVAYYVWVWAYSLMDNHVHLILVPEFEDSLSRVIHDAHGEYTRYFNAKYQLVGHTWHGRFKAIPMDEWHCWNAIRYAEQNPVRAGIVKNAEDYLWSSAAAHCGLRDDMLLRGDCPLVGEINNWSEWLKIEDTRMNDLIRRQTRLERPIGSDEFIRRLEVQTGRSFTPRKRGPKPKPEVSFPGEEQEGPDFDQSSLFR
jgi:putative transposase